MPPKIRELIRDVKALEFKKKGGKGSHRKFEHPSGRQVIISGKLGADAKLYQQKEVKEAIEEVKKWRNPTNTEK